MSQNYLTAKEAMQKYLRKDDGTYLISRSSFLKMCKNGTIPNCSLGMERKIFIPVDACERLWGKDSFRNNCKEVTTNG